jgi:proteasome lid subunit RPN8/RPN11
MLIIAADDYVALRRHGEETYPAECCGILLGLYDGESRLVRRLIRCENAAPASHRDRYEIDPREVIRAQREAREAGVEIIGFYHSHPDHPPRWSSVDLEQAHWIGCSYVITSVGSTGVEETKSFLLAGELEEDKHFIEEEIVISTAR